MKKLSFVLFIFLLSQRGYSQVFNLVEALRKGKLQFVNRQNDKYGLNDIKISEGSGEGLVWLKNKKFKTGTIEIELKGQDVFQKSFLGIAFNGQNDSTYEAIYFRPFNFHAKDSVRRIHAVQYIAHPQFTWKHLREFRNGEFEKGIKNAPNPNDWFQAKIVVLPNTITVFVDTNADPILVVKRMFSNKKGRIGLFLGDGSGGEYKNLNIY